MYVPMKPPAPVQKSAFLLMADLGSHSGVNPTRLSQPRRIEARGGYTARRPGSQKDLAPGSTC